jgi:uncharacterized protein YgiM (DUF1202 family)
MWRVGVVLVLFILISLGITTIPAAAQAGLVWNAQFYNNGFLQDPVALSRQDSAVAFDWGAGSPGPGVNADNFSARWGTDPFFQAGTYRFWALADDGVKVSVDFNTAPIINTIGQSKVGQVVSADITLTQGQHHIQVDYQEATGNAFVYVTWANLATNPTGPNFPVPGGSLPPPVSGVWTAQYFANPNLAGSPTLIQSEVSPSHDWGNGSPLASIPADNFSARWTSVQTLNAGNYQVSVRADDGVRVLIDGITYINEFHTATGATYTANVSLSAGQHTFLIEYYEAGGLAFLNYNFTPAGMIVPTPLPTGATATVTGAYRLNVRNAPSAVTGAILTKISRNETYPIVGRNNNTSWWQLNVNGVIGWVNARYVTAFNAHNVPVTWGVIAPTSVPVNCSTAPLPRLVVGRLGRVTPGLPNNIRASASSSSRLVGQIPSGGIFTVLSAQQCAEGYYWWQVNYNGVIGWTPEGGRGQYWLEPL